MEQATPQPRQAVEDLVRDHLAFVVRVASDYRNMGLDFEDLRSEGNVGLIKAAARFDPSQRGPEIVGFRRLVGMDALMQDQFGLRSFECCRGKRLSRAAE